MYFQHLIYIISPFILNTSNNHMLLRRRAPVVGSVGLQISKDPKRRKLGAMRDTTEQRSMTGCPVYSRSRSTRSSLVTTLPARVVGMPCTVYSHILAFA